MGKKKSVRKRNSLNNTKVKEIENKKRSFSLSIVKTYSRGFATV